MTKRVFQFSKLLTLRHGLIAMTCVCCFAALAAGEKNQEPLAPLVVYSPHGTEMLKMVTDRYQKKYPNEKIDWRFYGAEDIADKIANEKNNPIADVWWGGPQFMFIDAENKGLFAPFPKYLAERFESKPTAHSRFWIGDMQAPITLFYQKDMLAKFAKPKDWDSLLDKAYTGKIALRTSQTSGTMRALIVALIDWNLRNGKSLDQALSWLKQFDRQVGAYYTHSQLMLQAVGRGLQPIGVWNMPEVAMRMRQGFSLDFVFPTSGIPVLVDGLALLKKQKQHPSAAKFADFLLSKDIATTLARAPFHRLHLHKDLDAKDQPSYTRHPQFKIMPVDWDRIAKEGSDWLKAWEKVFDEKKVKR